MSAPVNNRDCQLQPLAPTLFTLPYITLGLLVRFPLPRLTPSASDGILMSDKTSATGSFFLASLNEPVLKKKMFNMV
jgi:hypothetical protein